MKLTNQEEVEGGENMLDRSLGSSFSFYVMAPASFSISVFGPVVTITQEEMEEIGQKTAQALEKRYGIVENQSYKRG